MDMSFWQIIGKSIPNLFTCCTCQSKYSFMSICLIKVMPAETQNIRLKCSSEHGIILFWVNYNRTTSFDWYSSNFIWYFIMSSKKIEKLNYEYKWAFSHRANANVANKERTKENENESNIKKKAKHKMSQNVKWSKLWA